MAKGFGISLLENWKCLLEGVKRASAFLEEEKIFDAKRLPTDFVVPVLTALWAHSPKGLDGEGYARAVMRKYTWRAFFTQRYERTTNQRALSDYHELKALIQKQTASCPVIFDDAQYPLPRAEDLALAGWPKKKERLARAILALSLKQGGLDLAEGGTETRASLAQREYHHLFPNSLLKGRSVPDDKIYIALNCALVTWNTNRNISNKDPERYLAERRNGRGAGETEVRARLASHLVPYDEMVAGNYDAFLLRRASMMHNAMLNVCGATLKSPRT